MNRQMKEFEAACVDYREYEKEVGKLQKIFTTAEIEMTSASGTDAYTDKIDIYITAKNNLESYIKNNKHIADKYNKLKNNLIKNINSYEE